MNRRTTTTRTSWTVAGIDTLLQLCYNNDMKALQGGIIGAVIGFAIGAGVVGAKASKNAESAGKLCESAIAQEVLNHYTDLNSCLATVKKGNALLREAKR